MISRGEPRVELILSVVTQDTRYPPKKSDQTLDSGVETPPTMKWQCPLGMFQILNGMDEQATTMDLTPLQDYYLAC